MINCFILDDEQHSIDVLIYYVRQIPYLNLIGTNINPSEALQKINEENIQLLFTDVQMPNISGLDIVQAIKGKCKIILTTAYSEYALKGYELDVVDYLLKPIPFPRFMIAVQKVHDLINASIVRPSSQNIVEDYIFIKQSVKGKVERINFIDIDYIESVKNYVAIHHGKSYSLVYISMKELETKLPSHQFIRVHKSFIIPISRVAGMEGNRIILKNINVDITLGETFRPRFIKHINDKTIGG